MKYYSEFYNVTMTLRYSKACHALWIRTLQLTYPEFIPYFRMEICNVNCVIRAAGKYTTINVNGTYQWSSMLAYTSSVPYARICGQAYENVGHGVTYGNTLCNNYWNILNGP